MTKNVTLFVVQPVSFRAASPHGPLLAAPDSSPIQLVPILLHYSGYDPGQLETS